MALREPLVSFREGEVLEDFAARALEAARDAGGSGRLRLELSRVLTGRGGIAASLWVERGTGTTESWQRVTGLVIGDNYKEALGVWARALEVADTPPF